MSTDVSIVAHEDDDTLFMQPDIINSYRDGIAQVVVFVTAGNLFSNDTVYMQQREHGAMDAYAQMGLIVQGASGAESGSIHWKMERKTYGGMPITGVDCDEFPDLHLIFLRLYASKTENGIEVDHDIGNNQVTPRPNLSDLYRNPTTDVCALDDSARYDKARLEKVLSDILKVWTPRLVRTQDSDNPHPVDDPNVYRDPKTGYYYDHSDHYYASLFARDALRSYVNETGAKPEFWIYRGYNISEDPVNLDPDSILAKDWMFYYYALNDYYWFWNGSISKCEGPRTVTDPNATGTLDRFVRNWPGTSYRDWIERTYATQKALPQ